MKKLVVISIILFAGFSVMAQDGGRAVIPDCYKCIFTDVKPLEMLVYLTPEHRPYLPKVEGYIKCDKHNVAIPREPRMLNNPGNYIENYNLAIPVGKKLH